MEEAPKPISTQGSQFGLTRKEWVTLIFGTALALGSFKSDDPWVVIPMLAIAGVAFVVLCMWHHGRIAWRVPVAGALLFILAFIGWRDLRHTEQFSPSPQPSPAPTSPTINQTATDSDCSNLVAGSNAQIKCKSEKERHGKENVPH